MKILSIESSCDETSAAVVEKAKDTIRVLSTVTASSLDIHATTGGIIPENAARKQVEYILPVISEALVKSEEKEPDTKSEDLTQLNKAREILKNKIDAIAVTFGPGLIGSLLVGVETAKTLSYVFNKPITPVNHLLAHIYANFISISDYTQPTINFPYVGLIVSGGHTDLLLFKSHTDFQWLGGTRDDAAGEAFDKIGRVLSLPYPAGPEIERRAQLINNSNVRFKSPLINEDNFDFSFSGLKTEAIRYIEKERLIANESNNHSDNEHFINEVCFATQKAIIDVLIKKTLKAVVEFSCSTILVGGGVSANETFRQNLKEKSMELGVNTFFPEKQYSTDNAAMIGAYALKNPKPTTWDAINANPELYFT